MVDTTINPLNTRWFPPQLQSPVVVSQFHCATDGSPFVLHLCRRIQFWQTCRKFFDNSSIIFRSESENDIKNCFFFQKPSFPQNVLLEIRKTDLINLPKQFCSIPKFFCANLGKFSIKVRLFLVQSSGNFDFMDFRNKNCFHESFLWTQRKQL